MNFVCHAHRFGLAIAEEPEFRKEWHELQATITSISDEEIIRTHQLHFAQRKSISTAINYLLKERLTEKNWNPESKIFSDDDYREGRWRLDFAKESPGGGISIEVAFNHGEAIAWNLLKPVLASELNHVEKDAQTRLGVVIMATEALKQAGGFDGAVGTYEKAIRYLKPLQAQLTVPMILVGLLPPSSFVVHHVGNPKRASFERL